MAKYRENNLFFNHSDLKIEFQGEKRLTVSKDSL